MGTKNNAGPSNLPKPTPMSTTSRTTGSNHAQHPKQTYMSEELFNLEQESASGDDQNYNYEYYYSEETLPTEEEIQEIDVEVHDKNFQEDSIQKPET